MTIPDRGGLRAVDSLDDMVGHFGFCTLVEVNENTKLLYDFKE